MLGIAFCGVMLAQRPELTLFDWNTSQLIYYGVCIGTSIISLISTCFFCTISQRYKETKETAGLT